MITVKIEEDDLLNLLINRVKYWTEDDQVNYDLFYKMYENYVYGGCFDGAEINIMHIVDNDYLNYTRVIYEGEDDFEEVLKLYKEQGCGDVSCETDICDFIEAVSDDEKAILVR